jgi:YD repeat-containing protein
VTSADDSGGDDYAYGYDANSNRTSITVNGATTTATYNAADQITGFGSETFGYDANGNQTARTTGAGTTTWSYDARNFTAQTDPPDEPASDFDYTDSTQTQRLSAGASTFTNSPLGVVSRTEGLTTDRWTRDPAGQLVSQRGAATSSYYLTDALGLGMTV